ncbi:hypothetical protein [Acrocarpospora corrugata]|nr:hypothetical protein [Acrocarpospora corrugata]
MNGPGRYRLRVYARVTDEYEQHLIVAYPGRSTKKVVYRAQ